MSIQSTITEYKGYTISITTQGAYNVTDISVVLEDMSEVKKFTSLENAIEFINNEYADGVALTDEIASGSY